LRRSFSSFYFFCFLFFTSFFFLDKEYHLLEGAFFLDIQGGTASLSVIDKREYANSAAYSFGNRDALASGVLLEGVSHFGTQVHRKADESIRLAILVRAHTPTRPGGDLTLMHASAVVGVVLGLHFFTSSRGVVDIDVLMA
jgi:hypothetical protein